MPRAMKIDYISDVSCPWCAVGLKALEKAISLTSDLIDAEITFQPYELDSEMPPGGENSFEYVARKYGLSAEQTASNRDIIRARAAAVGFNMAALDRRRLYNTFDAHRLVHWAHVEGRQIELKDALFDAHFTDGQDVSNHDVLVAAAKKAGLDGEAAREVLRSGRYSEETRHAEQLWRSRGIRSVPTVIIDNHYVISGSQPPEVFEQTLRQIAAKRHPKLSER
jgi:predicted DsbA family dithiol-disulfide isomerase